MTLRRAVHDLVDELADDQLEAAKHALEQMRADPPALTPEELADLAGRAAECDAGDVIDARAFLAALRRDVGHSHG